MRILWHGPHPDMPTGYANQTSLILPRLQALGHEVAISLTAGQDSHPGWWRNIPVLPCTPYAEVGEDTVTGHYQQTKSDIVFTLLCTWLLKYPRVWQQFRTVHITPVDCDPISFADWEVITSTNGTPAAVSRFGERMMRAGGLDRTPLDPLYLPHGVDTKCFAPSGERDTIRADVGVKGLFVVGMNFMNNDRLRKNIDPAIRGFAKFHGEHPDTRLALHAIQALPEGIHLLNLIAHLGIADAVMWSPQHELVTGEITPPLLADWYNTLDVYLSPGNEGFGLPAVEAQACGTPGILGNWSTGPDLVGPGWLVEGQGHWNDKHRATWGMAFVDSIAAKLGEAYETARDRRDDARTFALEHDINKVVREHWEPVLGELG